ncbi:SHD1 domain-containing protein [Prosthecobacter sp.]|uniref:SHD1 domain-containing protein n=1 Tax=Prosthecobacter sp. TaxID=1965333 RepID=UPI002AB82A73|nr:SHD1 domain-containing protein [Prosthecobacter sp.]MDZ4402781.1 SHD1 domain-containing protein [Prosthecobacter sp.]
MKTKTNLLHVCLVFCVISTLQARTWTEAQTGRTMEGEFVKVLDNAVVIRSANGSTVQLPLARLSEADQTFVKEQAEAAPKATAAKADEKSAGKDDVKKQLLGTWDGYMADSDGSRHGDIRLEITEEKITASNPRGNSVMGAGTYRISGKRIDATGTEGQFAGKKYEGIFDLDSKTLKWCSANDNPNSNRPSKLQTNTQAGQFLMVLEKK